MEKPELTPEMQAYLSYNGTQGGYKAPKGFAVNRESLIRAAVTRARRAEERRREREEADQEGREPRRPPPA